jgi:hypothetical protein
MTNYILEHIPFHPDLDELAKTVRLKPGSPMLDDLRQMAEQAQALANPKVVYRVALVEASGDRSVIIDEGEFSSRVLRVNLEKVHRAFPFVATCGRELKVWADTHQDMLQRFWADAIMEQALFAAIQELDRRLEERYQPGPMSSMNPGSLEDWPITQQKPLFGLFGDTRAQIGVELTESMLMIPAKSVSGVLFPSQEGFVASCQLCPREVCPNRRAPYDPALFDQKYALTE